MPQLGAATQHSTQPRMAFHTCGRWNYSQALGGLALGAELAGCHHQAVIEWDKWACDTINQNRARQHPLVSDWPVHQCDVRSFDWTQVQRPIDIVAGGPPCQPFSMGGKHRAANDERDMFPAATEAVRVLQPRAFVFENVRGLTRPAFSDYFEYVLLRLRRPFLRVRPDERWEQHLRRLRAASRTGCADQRYEVRSALVNAADYGVPQQRHRVFIVGFRSDLACDWVFPRPTHSKEALLHDQWVTGVYWERHGVPAADRGPAPSDTRLAKLREADRRSLGRAWRTVRDAIADLPEAADTPSRAHLNHVRQDGARSYPGHTGSPLDWPAKALKAGGHGVPGGENMLRRPDGTVRYFTVRESARLQTFPDDYELHGSWGEAMRQLGNAVPVQLAHVVFESIVTALPDTTVDIRDPDRRQTPTLAH